MKLIKDRVLYDTATATEVARHVSGEPGGFGYRDDRLYRTKNGNWFFVHSDNDITDSLEPIEIGDAMGWLENAGEYDAMLRYFRDYIHEA